MPFTPPANLAELEDRFPGVVQMIVVKSAVKFSVPPTEIEDLTQEIYMNLADTVPQAPLRALESEPHFLGWLTAIIRNRIFNLKAIRSEV